MAAPPHSPRLRLRPAHRFLCKLIAAEVWNFTTFMCVVSFIVLGAALILLGLFYNKFSEAIKALLDSERELRGNG